MVTSTGGDATTAPRPVGKVGRGGDGRSPDLRLASGLGIAGPRDRLLHFCREEYAYYDAIADADPDRVMPLDVLATVAMNSRVDDAPTRFDCARRVRTVHLGMAAACDLRLTAISADSDVLDFDPELELQGSLLHAAVQAPQVLVAVATKVLHRRRRGVIPMLGSVVLDYYLDAGGRADLKRLKADKRRAAAVAVLKDFRADLRSVVWEVAKLRGRLAAAGFAPTPIRILEVLVWTETEPRGYYRQ